MRDPDQLISLPSIIEGRKDVIKLDSVRKISNLTSRSLRDL